MAIMVLVIWAVIAAFINFGNTRWTMGRAFKGWLSDVILGGIGIAIVVTGIRWLSWVFA